MKYISMFSGIEAATVAWEPLGWKAQCFAEFDKFPSAVLKFRWPDVKNHGDMTKPDWKKYRGKADLVVGVPPCQAFSIAGLRKSLDDDRGNLSLQFMRAIHAIRPTWFVVENVPGWLSTPDNAFGCVLAGLTGSDDVLTSPLEQGRWPDSGVATGPVYGLAWRVLDAQHFGVPQRRRRVFIVGHLGDWRPAAKVLLEPRSMHRNPSEGSEQGEGLAPAPAEGSGACCGQGECCTTKSQAQAQEGGEACPGHTGGAGPVQSKAFAESSHGTYREDEKAGTTKASGGAIGGGSETLAFSAKDHGADAGPKCPTIRAGNHDKSHANSGNWPGVAGPEEVVGFYPTNRQPECGNYEGKSPPVKVGSGGEAGNPPGVAGANIGTPEDKESYAVRMREGKEGGGKGPLVQKDKSGTIATGNDQTIFTNVNPADGKANCCNMDGSAEGDKTGCLVGGHPGGTTDLTPIVFPKEDDGPKVFQPKAYTRDRGGDAAETCPPLTARADRGDSEPCVYGAPEDPNNPSCFQQNQRDEVRSLGDKTGAVLSDVGAKGQNYVFDPLNSKADEKSTSLGTNCGMSTGRSILFEPRSPDGEPRIHEDTCPTLNTMGGGQREPCVASDENTVEGEQPCMSSGVTVAPWSRLPSTRWP